MPYVTVFAGPNGSGKSSATRTAVITGRYINADEIKKEKGCSDMEAAVEAERQREVCLKQQEDFTFETVLSTNRNLDLLRRAKIDGYKIHAFYITTADPELNALRVAQRVAAGGHDVPREKIISRYHRSMENIHSLYELANSFVLYDNTMTAPLILAEKKYGETMIFPNDLWSEESIRRLLEP